MPLKINNNYYSAAGLAGTMLLVTQAALAENPTPAKNPPAKKSAAKTAGKNAAESPHTDFKIPAAKTYEDRAYEFIAELEGKTNRAYVCTAGKCTIGVGFNIDANEKLLKKTLKVDDAFVRRVRDGKEELSEDQIQALFKVSLQQAEQALRDKLSVTGIDLDSFSERQKIALVSLAFNSPALIGPKLRAALRDGDEVTAACEIALNSNRDKVWGLCRRREKEATLFLGRQLSETERKEFLKRDLTKQELRQKKEYEGKEIALRAISPAEVAWKIPWDRPRTELRIAQTSDDQIEYIAPAPAALEVAELTMRLTGTAADHKPSLGKTILARLQHRSRVA